MDAVAIYAMSEALANASRLRPEIRLAQAISEFAADLPDQQKRLFTFHSRAEPPRIDDVRRLAAEVDNRAAERVGGRCFGPRLMNFLHATQRFAAIGDVVIGGSQNLAASALWAVVRVSLLVIIPFKTARWKFC